ncbi:unnamed protein product [Linum tenue]|uniref:Uncharacterized protein n=1 Tax=Linum tenue TaxID=586396 RepID=A0AAV0RPA1_9ROSI|nr:unnamed protein product [Linum tenue]
MKTKVESSKGNDVVEMEKLKTRLQEVEVEEAIVQLAEANDQLRKDVRGGTASSPEEIMVKAESNGVTEQARKWSEKIGSLEFEVQNIQYVLLKLDEKSGETEKKSNVQHRFYGSKTGVLLRDFISSGGKRRSLRRRKKGCFCGCGRPATIEEA